MGGWRRGPDRTAPLSRELARNIGWLVSSLPPDGALWIAWPKPGSEAVTDLGDEAVREAAMATARVWREVWEVDPTWTALEPVRRREEQPGPPSARALCQAARSRATAGGASVGISERRHTPRAASVASTHTTAPDTNTSGGP